jgi:signal transduction histidine kinase
VGVRIRATVAAVAVVALALGASAVVVVLLVGRTITETVSVAVQTRADEVAAELASEGRGPGGLRLADSDDGVLVQVVDGDGVVAASPGLADRPPLVAQRLAIGGHAARTVDGALVGESGEQFRLVAVGVDPSTGADRVVAVQSLAVAEDTETLVTRLAAWGIPLLLVVVGAATWTSVGHALRPVEAIRARTAGIGAADLTARVPVPGARDEVAALARTMNAMLARLEASAGAQRAFVSDAGHEMRSPLAAIRTEMEVAHRAGLSASTIVDVLSETARLERLVDDLLLLARTDEGQLALHLRDVDLDDLLDAERARLRNRSDLAVSAAIRPVRVVGDRAALARVLRNLVDNGVRHSRGRLHLACRSDGGSAWIEVSDDGPGVPVGERERVFERFVRLDEARARDGGGSGLGLAIVWEIVQAHGGDVRFSDSGPLPGATVVVRLPVQPPSAASR